MVSKEHMVDIHLQLLCRVKEVSSNPEFIPSSHSFTFQYQRQRLHLQYWRLKFLDSKQVERRSWALLVSAVLCSERLWGLNFWSLRKDAGLLSKKWERSDRITAILWECSPSLKALLLFYCIALFFHSWFIRKAHSFWQRICVIKNY